MEQENRQMRELKERLMLSEKRYEIAMGFSDVAVFDYDLKSKKLVTQHADFEAFGMPGVLEQGPEDVIASGIIAERSYQDFYDLYRKIDAGAPSAKITVYANALDGTERILELLLVNIFDEQGNAVRAVGVRKDVTDAVLLKKERTYGNMMMTGWHFAYEAHLQRDVIVHYDDSWARENNLCEIRCFSDMVKTVCEREAAPEHREKIMHLLSAQALAESFRAGRHIVTFEYRRKMKDETYQWFEQSVNIIEDEIIGGLCIRAYIRNIDERKQKEERVIQEQHFYESMVSKADVVMEINLTANTVVGDERMRRELSLPGVTDGMPYDLVLQQMLERMIHPEDRQTLRENCERENVLEAYRRGICERECEYRIANHDGDFVWVNSTMHTFEDPKTGDIRGFIYSRDIDEEKKAHLELLYKSQHDLLTGFYNKITLEEKINEYLETSDAKAARHAFFMLDLDYFKEINDNFGHAFGDVLLSQLGGKVGVLFRKNDIIGRIGGDEFVILMKNIPSEREVVGKAHELCETIAEIYMQNQVEYRISASVGIAFYHDQGRSYSELYHNADMALYHSKQNGRNRYSVFRQGMELGKTNIKEIDSGRLSQSKRFHENVNDYMFRILYENDDKNQAINAVLELIGKHFGVSRAYIFENSLDDTHTSNTYEWCDIGIPTQQQSLQQVAYAGLGDYRKNFNNDGYFYIAEMEQAAPPLKALLGSDDAKSTLQFAILKDGRFVGFIGFSECAHKRVPTNAELVECRNLANMLGVFLAEMRAVEEANQLRGESERMRHLLLCVLDSMDSYVYVCDARTGEILMLNEKLRAMVPGTRIGEICYQQLWDGTDFCTDCPMMPVREGLAPRCSREMYNPHLKLWLRVTVSKIDWQDKKDACLVQGADITKYMTKP